MRAQKACAVSKLQQVLSLWQVPVGQVPHRYRR